MLVTVLLAVVLSIVVLTIIRACIREDREKCGGSY